MATATLAKHSKTMLLLTMHLVTNAIAKIYHITMTVSFITHQIVKMVLTIRQITEIPS